MSADGADGERRSARVAEMREHVDELADRVALPTRDAEQLRQLLHGHEDRQPEHEPLHDRARQELGDEPQPQQAREQEKTADKQHECCRIGEVVVVTHGKVADGRSEQDCRGGRPATTTCRLVPKIAYAASVASSVYRPACGGRPARPEYAIISGTSSPHTVAPAITSNRNRPR